ncbi:iron-containing alcohol dehydrogenase [Bradyrhizobium sp. KBS0727]|uniref:iron-containing alcohol dehydrogenase n=1 Tax=unclassified Bradyrhizobium TaxID=2631580 RepID=UPI00110E7306|nr:MULTISPECIES: iron-containing alcohol dehydrogenase [unclassified Bradyrhizobium]QDW40616.1 iron-containing alcohol dehydrogenase [Bradyrhizobium sp. KBS0725]QDW47221.1 iron-containing alcohol dehydrogenase [Bradyrhizobium sp. KBS0727]
MADTKPRPTASVGSIEHPVRRGSYSYPRTDIVHYGLPWAAKLNAEVDRLGARRVFVVASSTLLRSTSLNADLSRTLGAKLVGLEHGIRAHTPLNDVFVLLQAVKLRDADILVAIGGGSVIDGVKIMQLAAALNASGPNDLARFKRKRAEPTEAVPLRLRMIAIPTTLSGAEFTAYAGGSDLDQGIKEGYGHPEMIPLSVILDPAITTHTPEQLWLSTGIRAVDHAVEDICSVSGQPLSDAASIHALKLLSESLRQTMRDPLDLDARLQSMVGVWLSLIGSQGGVNKGASHAIGHILGGSAGVAHGLTSCVMLPHVLRWNAAVNPDRQKHVSTALGDTTRPAAELVAELIHELGLPNTLKDVGVHRDQFDRLARLTMDDPWARTNPRLISGPEDVRALLEAASG